MANWSGMTVDEILKHKKASIRTAALDPGSPNWDDILHLTWEEIQSRAKRNRPGYKTFKKLLGSREYNR